MNKILIKINSNTNAKSAKKNIRFEHELIDEINDVKYENQSFSSWVKQACREKIRRDETLCAQEKNRHAPVVRTKAINTNQDIKTVAQKLASQGAFLQQIADKLNSCEQYKMASKKKWTRQSVRELLK